MSLTLEQISQVLSELKLSVLGGRIDKIQQPFPDALSLHIRGLGQSHILFISTNPKTSRLHLLNHRLKNPITPPLFCQFLRKHILSSSIRYIEQIPNDRIVWMELLVNERTFYFVIALTGKSANLFLLDNKGSIIQTLKPEPPGFGQYHKLLNLLKAESDAIKNESLNKLSIPTILDETRIIDESCAYFPISSILEEHYLKLEKQEYKKEVQEKQISSIKKTIKLLERKMASLIKDLEKANQYREYRNYGELLKSHIDKMTTGQSYIQVINYYNENLAEITLPLDPAKNPKWNLDNYFRKYRKFIGAEREARPRLKQTQAQIAALQKDLERAKEGKIELMPSDIQEPHKPKPSRSSPSQSKKRGSPCYREFLSSDNLLILVGKNALYNDELTFKVAKPNDLWLHARGTPGSHVVVAFNKKTEIPKNTIREAAMLALLYSDLRKNRKGEVIYSPRKYVKKSKGQKAGSVTVTREKTIWVELNEDALEYLKRLKVRY